MNINRPPVETPGQPLPPRPDRRPKRPMPVTVEEKLADVIRRLGHIEKHLIDIRDAIQLEPDKPRYVIDRCILG